HPQWLSSPQEHQQYQQSLRHHQGISLFNSPEESDVLFAINNNNTKTKTSSLSLSPLPIIVTPESRLSTAENHYLLDPRKNFYNNPETSARLLKKLYDHQTPVFNDEFAWKAFNLDKSNISITYEDIEQAYTDAKYKVFKI